MSVYQNAIDLWGATSQIDMMIEECAELIHALQKIKRGRPVNVSEELADVEIMCEQMRVIFSSSKIDREKEIKLQRLRHLIATHP